MCAYMSIRIILPHSSFSTARSLHKNQSCKSQSGCLIMVWNTTCQPSYVLWKPSFAWATSKHLPPPPPREHYAPIFKGRSHTRLGPLHYLWAFSFEPEIMGRLQGERPKRLQCVDAAAFPVIHQNKIISPLSQSVAWDPISHFK